MPNEYFQDPGGSIDKLTRLQILQTQMANRPTFGDKALMSADAAIREAINYKQGRDLLQAQRQEKQIERETQMAAKGFRMDESGKWVRDESLVPAAKQTPQQLKIGINPATNQHEYFNYNPSTGTQEFTGLQAPAPQARTYAKQLKVVNGEWVIFDPQSGGQTHTGQMVTAPDKAKLPTIKQVKDIMGNTKFFKWDATANNGQGALIEVQPEGGSGNSPDDAK